MFRVLFVFASKDANFKGALNQGASVKSSEETPGTRESANRYIRREIKMLCMREGQSDRYKGIKRERELERERE